MRIHLGHHFYGAGNLGDDFMLAGFLTAMRTLAPEATFTCSVPFPLAPLRHRFPGIDWRAYTPAEREGCIRAADAWLGLGGSPFQSAQSRWFIDHLIEDAALCRRHGKPMAYLGVGVQQAEEVNAADVRGLIAQAQAIWTRDPRSAERLVQATGARHVAAAADLAHLFLRQSPPPPPRPGRATLVANFDYAGWRGLPAALTALDRLPIGERVWLAQESRELPGAEIALHRTLPKSERDRWRLIVPDAPGAAPSESDAPGATRTDAPPATGLEPGAPAPHRQSIPLGAVLRRWPTGEWLLTSRFHAALAGAWGGSKIVVIATNEKLRAVAEELGTPAVSPNADADTVLRAFQAARPAIPPAAQADRAWAACEACVRGMREGKGE